jgi:hypothetical protein
MLITDDAPSNPSRSGETDGLRERWGCGVSNSDEDRLASPGERHVEELPPLVGVVERGVVEVREYDDIELLAFGLMTREQVQAS